MVACWWNYLKALPTFETLPAPPKKKIKLEQFKISQLSSENRCIVYIHVFDGWKIFFEGSAWALHPPHKETILKKLSVWIAESVTNLNTTNKNGNLTNRHPNKSINRSSTLTYSTTCKKQQKDRNKIQQNQIIPTRNFLFFNFRSQNRGHDESHQPKLHALLNREILQNYPAIALFDFPQMGNLMIPGQNGRLFFPEPLS